MCNLRAPVVRMLARRITDGTPTPPSPSNPSSTTPTTPSCPLQVGKISIRFVPDQAPGQLVELLGAHIHHEFAKLRSPNTCSVKVGGLV